MKVVSVVAGLAFVGTLAVACGTGTGGGFDVIADRQAAASYAIRATAPEMLADPSSYNVTIVEGSIVQIDDGVGMSWTLDEQGEEQRQILAFDDDGATVRSVHVTMTVRNVIAGAAPDTSDVLFGLIINDEKGAEAVRNDFVGKSYVAFLNESPVFDYETSMYGVELDGGLLCRRGDDQGLDCPALDDGLVGALAIESVTAQDLGHQG